MAGVTGNFAGLAHLRDAIARAIGPELGVAISQALGAAAMKQLNDEFLQSRDPYGQTWAPLKLRRGKPLLDTGRLRASARLTQRSLGFEIALTANYARTHQEGAVIVPRRARMLSWKVRGSKRRYFAKRVVIPRRQMIPDPPDSSPIWNKAMEEAGNAVIRRHFTLGGPG